jgi:putative oxidoreductase
MMNQNTAIQTAALVIRLALGIMFVAHGFTKLFVFTPAGTVAFFASLGIPAIFAYLSMAAEAGGGILLLAGVKTRLIGLLQMPVLLGALVVHSGNGWSFTSPNGGWEYPAFLVVGQVLLILLGNSPFSLLPTKKVLV